MFDRAVLDHPRLGIVIPVHGHPVLVGEAIEDALDQVAPFGIHVVVVNDGCPQPETHATCQSWARLHPDRVTYLRKPNGGLSDARNHGIRHLLDSFPGLEAIYMLDADNRLRPGAMERAMAALDADPEAGWIYPDIDMFGMIWAGGYGGPYSRLIHSAINVSEAGSLIRRAVFDAGVFFDTGFRQGFEDWDFFLSAGDAGFRGRHLEDFGFLYRKRPESMLADSEREGSALRRDLKAKHRGLYDPRSLARLEQEETPRHAILLADVNRVRLTTDPALPGREISAEDYVRLYWLAQVAPGRSILPPFLTVTTTEVLRAASGTGLLHWAFWMQERAADEGGVALFEAAAGASDRLSVQRRTALRAQRRAGLLTITARVLDLVMRDERTDWIDSLATAKPQPCTTTLEVTLPTGLPPLQGEAIFDFLALVHRLRRAPCRRAAEHGWDWRINGIGTRQTPHLVLRQETGAAVAWPRCPDGGLHIGFALPLVAFGGVEKVALNMARALRSLGWRPHLFIVAAEEAVHGPDWQEVFESVQFLSDPQFGIWWGEAGNYLGTQIPDWAQNGDRATAIGLFHWLDVLVTLHTGALAGILGPLRKLGVKTVASLHLSDLTETGRPKGNTYLSLAYEHAYDVIAPCSGQLADWCHALGVPQDKLVPVVNAPGFDLTADRAARDMAERATRPAEAPLRVLFLGRLDAQKGLERLEQVVEGTRSLPLDWRIVGKSVVSPGAPALNPVLARRLEPAVSTAEELAELHAWADVVILLSEYEGLPLTVLEAMRQGAVVIATDVGAVSEALCHGETGLLLPLDTAVPRALEALDRLSRDRAELARMSRAAHAAAEGRDWETAIGPLDSRLRRLLSAGRKGPADA